MTTQKEKSNFLKVDLYDALRWLFEGAVAWEAARTNPGEAGRHQKAAGMYASVVQARSLYEFFYSTNRKGDDARAADFAGESKWKAPHSKLYTEYMESGKPAQKRIFHLVYNRSRHSGGTGNELKEKVIDFAVDLRRLVEDFQRNADPEFRHDIGCALARATLEADKAAQSFGIQRPI